VILQITEFISSLEKGAGTPYRCVPSQKALGINNWNKSKYFWSI